MWRTSWLLVFWIFIIGLVLTGLSWQEAEAQSVEVLCPSGAGKNWIIIDPQSLEFIDGSGVDIGQYGEFRFLIVASDGKSPTDPTACGGAIFYPKDENLSVRSVLEKKEHIEDIAAQSLIVDADKIGENRLYIYFIGFDNARSADKVNDQLDTLVSTIREGMHQAISSPKQGDFAHDVTDYLLTEESAFLNESQIVGYQGFWAVPNDWQWGGLHAVYSTNGYLYMRYQTSAYNAPEYPDVMTLSPQQNVVRNGDFESLLWTKRESVAPYWETYNNGQAEFTWLREEWDEAIHAGKQSQMLGIRLVPSDMTTRTIGIHQTIEVLPNSTYNLSFYTLMRSDLPREEFNKGRYNLYWGIDYSGQKQATSVKAWYRVPLNEQPRIGSNRHGTGTYYQRRLQFQKVQGSISSGNSDKLTLFILGTKNDVSGPEINFNIDDVELFGPNPNYVPPPPPPPDADDSDQQLVDGMTFSEDGQYDGPAFTFPTPKPQIPTDPTQFLVYLRNNYSNIDGHALSLEGIYIEDSDSVRRVYLNLDKAGRATFISQHTNIQGDYINRLLNDTVAFFGGDSKAEVLSGQLDNVDQKPADCVLINGVRACPEMQKSRNTTFEGGILASGTINNEERTVNVGEQEVEVSDTDSGSNSIVPTSATEPVNLSPEDELRIVIADVVGDNNRGVIPASEVSLDGDVINVKWAIGDNLTDEILKNGIKIDIFNMLQAIHETDIPYYIINFEGTFSMIDAFGNTEEKTVVWATYETTVVDNINWSEFLFYDIYNIASTSKQHPEFED
ncbi:hypothetical protein QUF58_04325 [Anaerolineales bacterium HSG24]|nr:hypothetical protein [Anaerolineales bacterium HSG24]